MTVEGIDVSRWQASTPDLAGLGFLIARASIGGDTDGMYARHIAAAKRAGLVTGAYHFGYDFMSMTDQADLFVHAAGDVDFLFLDVEGKYAPSRVQAAAFIKAVQGRGRRCGLYHSESGYFEAGQDYDWVANWSRQPTRSWHFWQYTSSGHIAGYTGRLDRDRFDGSRAELRALAGLPPDTGTGGDMGLNIEANELLRIRVPKGTDIYDLAGAKIGTAEQALERTVYHRVNVQGDTAHHYYVGQFPGAGPGPDLLMVRVGPAIELDTPPTDCEEVVAGLKARIAKLEQDVTQAANDERDRIAQAEADRIEAI